MAEGSGRAREGAGIRRHGKEDSYQGKKVVERQEDVQ